MGGYHRVVAMVIAWIYQQNKEPALLQLVCGPRENASDWLKHKSKVGLQNIQDR